MTVNVEKSYVVTYWHASTLTSSWQQKIRIESTWVSNSRTFWICERTYVKFISQRRNTDILDKYRWTQAAN